MTAFINALLTYGPAPTLLVLSGLVGWLVKKMDEVGKAVKTNSDEDAKRAEELKAFVTTKIEASEKKTNERLEKHEDDIQDLSLRIADVQREYLPREEYWKGIAGWRTEISELRNLLIDNMKGK
jgi:ElaB/YqjD/DUF883 family membrane-anchored ribosome-binding protein